ncbi:site-2 protease family protein [Clostridium sp. MSJ-4]|uniref:Site-2 protease family protein n=1 Tax=Clostridium simiarum TaxID=2841506 RepID=A0ABS6EW75_9CLOT|nr:MULTISPECIES: site-2 protease family protein [Clostridium]MBU5590479.1 site-2 protease family protein [Clostridium simiarum]
MLRNFNILHMILMIPAILIGFTFHEYAHAVVADRLGDKTPRFQGRLTLNPINHIDPIGFIMILIVGFGWAKPVQVNPSAFKNYYKDDLKVSLAGPIANLLVAISSALILALFMIFVKFTDGNKITSIITLIINYMIHINVMLFFLNLMPIPGFDGFHIIRDLFPSKFYKYADTIHRYQNIILIIFIVSPIVDYLVGMPTAYLTKKLILFAFKITGL